MARDTGMAAVLVEAEVLNAVQDCVRAAIAAAPWPRALADVAIDVLSEPLRVLGGCLTPWSLMPLCCCMAACGEWRPALPAAAAIELYANALDLLDDLEDGDACAAVERHGAAIVMNLTTALLARAHTALTMGDSTSRRAQDALWEGLAVAAGGQHLDLALAGGAPLSVEQCLALARRKSGALTEACCRAGAAFATTDDAIIDLFGAFGCSLGLAAQLDNDLHSAPDETHKSDKARKAQSVPVAFARASAAARDLDDAALFGGLQMAYALLHAERARAQEVLEAVAAVCPHPPMARAALAPLLRRGPAEDPAAS